jgi:apolipoprotein N-acyltransferase
LAYAKLRAIETRRWVARSANTGISAVINEYGNIVNSKPWNTPAVIKYNIPQKSMLTFYVKHGDYLYQIFSLIGVLFLLWNWVLMFQKKISKKFNSMIKTFQYLNSTISYKLKAKAKLLY